LILILILLFLPRPSLAGDEEVRKSDTMTLYLENDLFAFDDNDRYYTHGTKISWSSRDLSNYREMAALPSWMHRLTELMPFVNDPGEQRSVSLSGTEHLHTGG